MASAVASRGYPQSPGWANPDVALYHGTLNANQASIMAGINVVMGRSTTDFGRGFYTTTNISQARDWARRMSWSRPGSLPLVIEFTVNRDDLASLESLWFARGDPLADDFWNLVTYCRSGSGGHSRGPNNGWYDVVVGPLASSVRRRSLVRLDGDQVSFHELFPGSKL